MASTSPSEISGVHALGVVTVLLLLAGTHHPTVARTNTPVNSYNVQTRLTVPSLVGGRHADVLPSTANKTIGASNTSARPTCVYSYFYVPTHGHMYKVTKKVDADTHMHADGDQPARNHNQRKP